MEEKEYKIEASVLTEYVSDIFAKAGMNQSDAEFTAKALVETNLHGVDSHGVMRVPIYTTRLLNGATKANPNIRTIRGSLGLEVIDGDSGNGIIVGKRAMERAVELARQFNVGVVGVKNSNHFGAAALYSSMAVEYGMVGIAMTNVKPLMVAPGAKKPVVGNNPFSIAVPTYSDIPFVLDMALSVVAGGKLSLAIKKNEKIPTHWATDKYGHPTDDPKAAFEGYLLPVGDFKGLGLAYAVDILAGVITGAAFGHGVESMYEKPLEPSNTGHMMIAINVEAIMGSEELKKRIDAYYDALKATPMWKEGVEMFFPGELEQRIYEKRQREGIPIPKKVYQELIEWGKKLNIDKALLI